MKYLTRRIRKEVVRLCAVLRHCLRKDGVVFAGLMSIAAVCLCLSLTVGAASIPEYNSEDSREEVMELQDESSLDDLHELAQDGLMAVARPMNLKATSSVVDDSSVAADASSQATKTTTSTSTVTTTTSTTESSAKETQLEEAETENEAASDETEPATWDEVEEEEYGSEVSQEPMAGSVYDYVSEDEIIMLAQTVAQEGGDCSYTQQACVIWTVLNRVDSWEWPNTISENLTMPGQFAYYPGRSYREDHYQVAYDQVYNWLFGGERYLGSDYQYFYGDGWRNHFYGKNSSEYVPD